MNMQENETILLLPIREISRLTGVNTVTLRAWERRYGLLKPTRTEKGHRLYSQEDVERVKAIQAWLVRGLAISKVKGILADETVVDAATGIDSVWIEYAARIETALNQLNRSALTGLLNELISLYPAELIADQLLANVLEQLQIKPAYGTKTKLAFLHSVVLEHFYFGHYRQRQTAKGKRLLVVKLNPDDGDMLPLILNYSLLVNTFQAEYIGYLPLPELVFAVEQSGAEGLVLYGDSVMHVGNLRHQLSDWQQTLAIPMFLAGKITRIFTEDRKAMQGVLAGDSLQEVLATLIKSFAEQ